MPFSRVGEEHRSPGRYGRAARCLFFAVALFPLVHNGESTACDTQGNVFNDPETLSLETDLLVGIKSGSGSITESMTYALGPEQFGNSVIPTVVRADFNNDGYEDVVLANSAETLRGYDATHCVTPDTPCELARVETSGAGSTNRVYY